MTPKQSVRSILDIVSNDYGPMRCTSEELAQVLRSDRALDDEISAVALDMIERAIADVGGGGKTTLLIAATVAVGALQLRGRDDSRLFQEIRRHCRTAIDDLKQRSMRGHGADELLQVAEAGAGGSAKIAGVLVESIRCAGKFGCVRVDFNLDEQNADVRAIIEPASAFAVLQSVESFPLTNRPMFLISSDPLRREQLQRASELADAESRRLVCISISSSSRFSASEWDRIGLEDDEDGRSWLIDIAVATGATVLDRQAEVTAADVGRGDSMRRYREYCLVYGCQPAPNAVNDRINQHIAIIDGDTSESQRERAQQHLSAVGAPYVEIVVSGSDDATRMRLYYNTCAGLHLARSAIEGGFVPGAGVALAEIASNLEDQGAGDGVDILASALRAPYECLDRRGELLGSGQLPELPAGNGRSSDPISRKERQVRAGGPLDPTLATHAYLEMAMAGAAEMVSICR